MNEQTTKLTADEIDSIISYITSCTWWDTDNPTIDTPYVSNLLEKLERMMREVEEDEI